MCKLFSAKTHGQPKRGFCFEKMYASNQFSSKETDDAKIQFDEKANRGQQNETAK